MRTPRHRSLLFGLGAAGILFAVTARADAVLPGSLDPAATASAKGAKKGDAKAEEEEIGTIKGMTIPRSGNRFLGVEIVDGNFKITFYNEKKKPVPPDVDRAALRWDPKYKVGMERLVLNRGGDPNALTSGRFIRPPYNFKLTIVLLGGEDNDDEGAGGETHVIDFRQ